MRGKQIDINFKDFLLFLPLASFLSFSFLFFFKGVDHQNVEVAEGRGGMFARRCLQTARGKLPFK
jgi:hypothetical protein